MKLLVSLKNSQANRLRNGNITPTSSYEIPNPDPPNECSLEDERRLVRYTFAAKSYTFDYFNKNFKQSIGKRSEVHVEYVLYYSASVGSAYDSMPRPIVIVATETPLKVREWIQIGNEAAEWATCNENAPISVKSEYSDSVDVEMKQFDKWKMDVPTSDKKFFRYGTFSVEGKIEAVRQKLVSE
jgi:hypothetical protein